MICECDATFCCFCWGCHNAGGKHACRSYVQQKEECPQVAADVVLEEQRKYHEENASKSD